MNIINSIVHYPSVYSPINYLLVHCSFVQSLLSPSFICPLVQLSIYPFIHLSILYQSHLSSYSSNLSTIFISSADSDTSSVKTSPTSVAELLGSLSVCQLPSSSSIKGLIQEIITGTVSYNS